MLIILTHKYNNYIQRFFIIKTNGNIMSAKRDVPSCFPCVYIFADKYLKVYVELLVHPEVIANKIGFGGLLSKLLFYKTVNVLKAFMR